MPDIPEEAVERLVGKCIVSANRVEDEKYLRLTFDDGASCTIIGGGYDGLWDDVYVEWAARQKLEESLENG